MSSTFTRATLASVAEFRAYSSGQKIVSVVLHFLVRTRHMLEDHAVEWIRSKQHIGFGLMGEHVIFSTG